ncbi:MAG: DNA phosphorothioation system sulfurtransferase DndC [Verrucomicrobiales bacterium]|nr:DNA phosphorothioation system sulfurtransferase DndC [Verrucomicrobiales bacterium]
MPKSIISELGLSNVIDPLKEEIKELYCADDIPWIIGYSGGKDSTATLQLVWLALEELPEESRHKPVHVISTDTMVENPVVSSWVKHSLEVMAETAKAKRIPVEPQLLHPKTEDSFWVNLIGKGYPAPRHKFRWCTERLKIRPSNQFISSVVSKSGEAILALGARKAESSARAHVLKKNERYRTRAHLSPSATLAGCLIYTPIEAWTNDDVWMFLNQVKNPWGHSNRDLLGMYAGASADGECPLVVDTSTPSCGDSRFGCWVCTLVEKDKSMTAMIQNDAEKEWMSPLLELRNKLDFRNAVRPSEDDKKDHHLRDFRRMNGSTQLMHGDKLVPGPYHQEAREEWLRDLLEAQKWIQEEGPQEVRDLELITIDELVEIRRIWVVDKHELEDRLPVIYKEATGRSFPGRAIDDQTLLGPEQMETLAELCGEDKHQYELTRELLSLTMQQQASARRAGLFDRLEKSLRRHFYDSKEDAINRAQEREKRLASAQKHQKLDETETKTTSSS